MFILEVRIDKDDFGIEQLARWNTGLLGIVAWTAKMIDEGNQKIFNTRNVALYMVKFMSFASRYFQR